MTLTQQVMVTAKGQNRKQEVTRKYSGLFSMPLFSWFSDVDIVCPLFLSVCVYDARVMLTDQFPFAVVFTGGNLQKTLTGVSTWVAVSNMQVNYLHFICFLFLAKIKSPLFCRSIQINRF